MLDLDDFAWRASALKAQRGLCPSTRHVEELLTFVVGQSFGGGFQALAGVLTVIIAQ